MKNNFKSSKGQYNRPKPQRDSNQSGQTGRSFNKSNNSGGRSYSNFNKSGGSNNFRPERPDRSDRPERSDRPQRPNQYNRPQRDSNQSGQSNNSGGRSYSDFKKPGGSGNFNRSGGSNNFNRSDRPQRPNQYSKPQRDSNQSGQSNNSGGRSYSDFKKPGGSGNFNRSGGSNNFNRSDRPKQYDNKPNYSNKPNNRFNDKNNGFNKANSFRPERSEKSVPAREKNIDFEENNENLAFDDIQETGSMTFGRNAVLELLKSGKTIDKIFVQKNQREGSITMIAAEAIRNSIPLIEVEKSKLDNMINGSSHQGVIAMGSEIEYCSVDDMIALAEEKNEKPFILIADKIMDSQNLGAIIRTAECTGVHGIIIPKRHAAGVSSVVNKISAGAVFHVKIAKVANIAATIEDLKERGVWAFASTSDAGIAGDDSVQKKDVKPYYAVDYDLPMCLVVGNEGEGLSQIVLQKSDFLITIPMYGKIESLNVSCATAVLLYEIKKQRLASVASSDLIDSVVDEVDEIDEVNEEEQE